MVAYLITFFQSHAHDNDSSNIEKRIKSLGSWANIMPNAWIINSELNAEEITEAIKLDVAANDLFFVTKIGDDYSGKLQNGALTWIDSIM